MLAIILTPIIHYLLILEIIVETTGVIIIAVILGIIRFLGRW